MKRIMGLLAVALVLSIGSVVAWGDVVYSQPYTTLNGYLSDSGFPQLMADNFMLGGQFVDAQFQEVEITDVHWWGGYFPVPGIPSGPDNFTIEFYHEEQSPAAIPFASYIVGDVGRTLTGDIVAGLPIYSYGCYLPSPLILEQQTTYYISIYNTANVVPGTGWFWSAGSGPDITYWFRYMTGTDWIEQTSDDLAFELTIGAGNGAIPEPLTCLLFGGSVLFGLGRLRRRLR